MPIRRAGDEDIRLADPGGGEPGAHDEFAELVEIDAEPIRAHIVHGGQVEGIGEIQCRRGDQCLLRGHSPDELVRQCPDLRHIWLQRDRPHQVMDRLRLLQSSATVQSFVLASVASPPDRLQPRASVQYRMAHGACTGLAAPPPPPADWKPGAFGGGGVPDGPWAGRPVLSHGQNRVYVACREAAAIRDPDPECGTAVRTMWRSTAGEHADQHSQVPFIAAEPS